MPYPNETKSVTLDFPFEYKGQKVETLDIRRPKVRDQLIADKQNKESADKEVHLMSLLAGVEPELIQELDFNDYEQVQEVIVGFRKKHSENETSSED
ncbi:phage tail assembly protein [Photobacterium alginatilyticum]|uniref:Phage tail assembly protein n=1 Tax=Photobacterium alginatilyticum TaxID=1775171 RepID=A0ABW9YLB8_9GAMM|nr:phage tail assembly protein [Photobacterium alginatilyticum]NBI54642.1 phage tail assembly protein [Photobacterium alginatilyticum]